MTDTDQATGADAKPGAPKLDQALVRAFARSIWKLDARERKVEVAKRKEDWEQKRPACLAQARKLIRQLQAENVDLRMVA